jgi:hypothetical protein
MLWPTLCVDDFFKNPQAVINFSKTLDYIKLPGLYPGERTDLIHSIDQEFFNNVTTKIIACLYPNEVYQENLICNAKMYFQRIKPQENIQPGFVHQDSTCEFTSIVYLSDEEDTGTAIYRNIKQPIPNWTIEAKKGYTNTKKQKTKAFKKAVEDNRKCFQQTFEFTSIKNRMVLFDGSQYHGVNNFGKRKKDRLTLITFFHSISRANGESLKYHVNECRKG